MQKKIIKFEPESLKVSIVTISFNQARFLEKCILSVVNQEYKNIEYIVVDPGSTDGSREIIEKYRDEISKVIYEPDSGPADGLNKGFRHASGHIYGFLNSDDILEPYAIRKIVDFFSTHEEYDVVSGHSWIIDENGKRIRRLYSDKFRLWMAACGACILSQPSTFFSSEKFKEVDGFNVSNRIAWDGELFIDMALRGAKFSLIDEILSGFRVHPEAITGGGDWSHDRIDYGDRIFKKIHGKYASYVQKKVCFLFGNLRKFLNLRDTIQRVLHGPVFGASKKSH